MRTLYCTAYHGLRAVLLDKSTWSSIEIYEGNSQYTMMGQDTRVKTHSITSSHAWHVSCCICFCCVTRAWTSRSPSRKRGLMGGCGSTGGSQSTALNRPIEKRNFLFFWWCQCEAVSDAMQPTTTNRIHPRYRWCGVGLCGVGIDDDQLFHGEPMCVSLGKGPSKLLLNGNLGEWPLWCFSSFDRGEQQWEMEDAYRRTISSGPHKLMMESESFVCFVQPLCGPWYESPGAFRIGKIYLIQPLIQSAGCMECWK